MLPAELRLKKKKDLDAVFQKGKSVKSTWMQMRTLKAHEQDSRFAVIVSKRVSKKAVERNRVRRLLQEAIRRAYPSLLPGYDCILLAFPGIPRERLSDLEPQVFDLLVKAGLMKGQPADV